MNTIITLPIKDLFAVSHFAAKKDVRYYLNGIALNRGHVVATNGHYMAAIPVNCLSDDIDIIIPNDILNLFLKGISTTDKKTEKDVEIHLDKTNNYYFLKFQEIEISFKPIDGTFPDWKRIMPADDLEIEPCPNFNWDYMALFAKAAKILSGQSVGEAYLSTHGTKSALVSFPKYQEFIGVIMPMRY